jgi:hypothetical protein
MDKVEKILEQRKDFDADMVRGLLDKAVFYEVGDDYLYMRVPYEQMEYVLVLSTIPREGVTEIRSSSDTVYSLPLLMKLVKMAVTSRKSLVTDVEGNSEDMRAFLVRLGFKQSGDIYLLEK